MAVFRPGPGIRTGFIVIILVMWRFERTVSIPFPGIAKPLDQTRILRDKSDRHHVPAYLPLPPNSAVSASKIVKRDLWELVGSSSDVISLEGDKNTSINSSPRYYTHTMAQSPLHTDPMPSHLNVQMRLNKLQYYFSGLRIFDEGCRQRLLCEISKDPAKFAPLSAAFLDETSYNGDEKLLSVRLLTSNDFLRLRTYIEAAHRGLDREGCDIWAYRCPQPIESLIDFKSLLTWREVLKWLTVKMVAKRY